MPTVTAHLKHCAGGHRQHIKKKKWKFKLLEMKKKIFYLFQILCLSA